MQPFITKELLDQILEFRHKECDNCVRDTDEEIIECDVYNNILEDCYKWKLKISAEQDYLNRLMSEKKLIEETNTGFQFKRFWKKNRDKFFIYNMYVVKDHEQFSSKDTILKLYDKLIQKAEQEQ